jgi:hypothetical protein
MLPSIHHAFTEQTATVRPDLTLYASLELSRATWLVTCLLPERDRMSKYSTPGGDGGALLGLLERMRTRAQQLTGRPVKIVVIQEAGLDGFGSTGCLRQTALKVMLSIQRPSQYRGAGGEPRRMRSTARRC